MASFVGRLFKLVWSLLTWVTLSALAAALFVGWYYFHRVDEEIRNAIHTRLASHYPHLAIEIGSARFLKGEGLRLRKVEFHAANQTGSSSEMPVLQVEELLLRCDPHLSDLLKGRLSVRQVQIRGLTIRATRERDGQWNLTSLWPPPHFTKPPDPLPEVIVEKAVLELLDRSSNQPRRLTCREINTRIRMKRLDDRRADAVHLVFQGAFTTDYCRQVRLGGALRTLDGAWSIQGDADAVQWSPTLMAALPAEWAARLQRLSPLRATSQLNFRISQRTAAAPLDYSIAGQLVEGTWLAQSAQPSLSNLEGEFRIDNQGLLVPRLSAQLGDGQLQGSLRAAGHNLTGPLTLTVHGDHVEVAPRLVALLPARLQQAWQKCQVVGQVSGDLQLLFDGAQWDTVADLTCHDLTLLHSQFPYPVTNCQGTVRFQQQVLNFDLTGSAGGTPITMKGTVRQPGPNATGSWEVGTTRWKAIDDALIAALPEAVQQFLQRLRLRGQIGFWARYQRETPTSPAATPSLTLEIHDGWINYDAFPYPIGNIRGKIECQDGRWRFRELQGWNDHCRITCDGAWMADQPLRPLTLHFRAQDVVLDGELQRAVRPEVQQLWRDLQLQGTLEELAVDLQHSAAAAQPQVEIRARQVEQSGSLANPSGLQIRPIWFPYRVSNLRGQVQWANGALSIQGLAGRHGNTRLRANLNADMAQSKQWRIQITDLAVDHLRVDEDLLSAVPLRQAEILRRREVSGTYSIAGALHLARSTPDLPITAGWDLLVDAEEAGFNAGQPIRHAFGQIRLRGHHDGRQFWSRGILQVDSLICRDLQVTRLEGPLWIDNQRLALGARVPSDSNPGGPKPLVASVYGGQLSVDAEVSLDAEARFGLRANLTSANVSTIARDTQIGQGNLAGQAFLELFLSGSALGPHTLNGQGTAQLRNGNLYELPLVLALLKLLSSGNRDTAAFSASDVSFHVRGDHIYFDRFDLTGDAITLKGIGEMGLDRRLNLDFYSIVGREQLWSPLVRPILGEASRQFLRIHVDGTLDDPVTTQEVLPALNETLQQMFPELAAYKGRNLEGTDSSPILGRTWWKWNR